MPPQVQPQTDIASMVNGHVQLQPQAPQQGNFFEKLLPTIGGIAGGALGSLTDVFDGPLGTIGGSAAGGALGQKIENSLTGDKGSTLAAGAENAVGSGVGDALGGFTKLLAGKVVAPLAEKGASKLVADQAPGVTKDLAEYITKDNGITDLNKAGQFADVLTGGANGANADIDGKAILNKYVENTLQNNGPKAVQISDLGMTPLTGRNAAIGESIANDTNTLQKSITNNSLSGTPQANAIRSKITGILNGVGQNAKGEADPMGALDAQRQIAKEGSDAMSNYMEGGRKDVSLKNMAQTYNDVSNTLKSRLKLNDIPVSDDDKEALASDIEKFGGPVSKSAASNVANEIRNTDGLTLSGVRNLESNWVQVKGALQDAADQANKNFGQSAGSMAKSTLPVAGAVAGVGGPKSILGTIGGLATSSPGADRVGASALSALAKGAKGSIAQKIVPLATRAAAIGAANLPNIAGSGDATGTSAIPQNNVSSGVGANMQGTTDPLSQIYQQLLTQEQASPANFASSLGPVLAQLAPQVQKQQIASGVTGNLGTAFQGAGGAQGTGGGLLSQLSSLIPGTSANTYTRQQQAAASTLAQLLGISPQDALQLTPQLMQSPSSASIPAGNMSSILGSI